MHPLGRASAVLLVGLAASLALGCAAHRTPRVSTRRLAQDVDRFATYHLEVADPSTNDLTLERAIHDELLRKGYRPADRAAADLLVVYEVDAATAHRDSLVVVIRDADDGRVLWRRQSDERLPSRHDLIESVDRTLAPLPRRRS